MSNDPPSREWNSTVYDRISGPQQSWGKKVLLRVQLQGNEAVLDAGCGTGRLTAELLEGLPDGRVVAVDISRNMLQTASENLTPKFASHIAFVAADLQDLPFHQAFDGIFSTAAFHWVGDHDRLFRSLHRSLKPGGWLVAQCGGGPNLAKLRERVAKLASTPEYRRYLASYREPWEFSDDETAAERLRNAGFVNVETSVEPAPTLLDEARVYSEFVRSVILHRHIEHLPDEKLRDQFMAELTSQAVSDDPPYSLDYWRLNLRGKAQ